MIGESNICKVLFNPFIAKLASESSFFYTFDCLSMVVPPIETFLDQMAQTNLSALSADFQALEPILCKLLPSAWTANALQDTFTCQNLSCERVLSLFLCLAPLVKGREVGLGGHAGNLGVVHFFYHLLNDEVEQVLRGLEPVGLEITVFQQELTFHFLRTGYSEFSWPNSLDDS